MQKQQTKQTIPDIGKVLEIRFPVADPYLTGKWYSDIFDLDPNSSDHFPLRENHSGQVVLHTKNGIELCFIKSKDKLPLNFNNEEGYNHAILLFFIKELDEVYKRMKDRGVQIYGEEIIDRGGCGQQFTFYDLDGRKIELNNWNTVINPDEPLNNEPKLSELMTMYLPVADPYITGKWYCDIFDLDPNSSDHSPLRKDNTGLVEICSEKHCYFFIKSTDKSSMSFNDKDNSNLAVLHFEVKNIDQIYTRMQAAGVQIKGNIIDDHGGCGNGFSFYDPDGRKVEISNSGTNELPPLLDGREHLD